MNLMKKTRCTAMIVMAFALVALTGACDKVADQSTSGGNAAGKGEATATKPAIQPLVPTVQMIDWCREHAVPESVCTRCNDSLIQKFKDKGDWCKEHGVPESQCFQCHPELKEQFAAQYKAKYGKESPATKPET
jgi:cobalt-zinc-cadmium efflux system membrane fusion protein